MKIKLQNRTSDSYYYTVEMKDGRPLGKDAEAVAELRRLVKQHNKVCSAKKYVKLQGRGPRRGVYSYNQSLPLRFATHADVYVYER